MKLIVDVGVGIAVERLLRESGHDVLTVRDVDPALPDGEILRRALRENRLLITMEPISKCEATRFVVPPSGGTLRSLSVDIQKTRLKAELRTAF